MNEKDQKRKERLEKTVTVLAAGCYTVGLIAAFAIGVITGDTIKK